MASSTEPVVVAKTSTTFWTSGSVSHPRGWGRVRAWATAVTTAEATAGEVPAGSEGSDRTSSRQASTMSSGVRRARATAPGPPSALLRPPPQHDAWTPRLGSPLPGHSRPWTTLPAVVSPELHGDVREGPNPLAVLADAARSLHGERDVRRLLTWAADAAREATGSAAAGVWLSRDDHWVSSGMNATDPALIG